MQIKLNHGKKMFIICAAASVVVLSAFSFFLSFKEYDELVQASPATVKNVNVQLLGNSNCQVGSKYAVSWDSDCKGGEAMVWLSTTPSDKANIGILVPLTSFSAANFGASGADNRIFFNDPWKFNLSHNANKNKLSWTVPSQLNLSKTLFASNEGVFYIYTLADGRIALHKIVKEPVQMPVMPDGYYLRVDVKGKNGCVATGYSQKMQISNDSLNTVTAASQKK